MNARRHPLGILLISILLMPLTAGCFGRNSRTANTLPGTRPTPATDRAAGTATQTGTTAAGAGPSTPAMPFVLRVTASEGRNLMLDHPDILLLDVRTSAEYARGHIPEAHLLPVEELAGRLSELPEDRGKPIMVYCQSGRRSAIAAGILADAGYQAIYDLGGINAWPFATER